MSLLAASLESRLRIDQINVSPGSTQTQVAKLSLLHTSVLLRCLCCHSVNIFEGIVISFVGQKLPLLFFSTLTVAIRSEAVIDGK